MKKAVLLFLLFFFFSLKQTLALEDLSPLSANYVPGQIIVKFKKGESPQELGQTVAAQNTRGQSLFGLVLNGLGDFTTHVQGGKTATEKLAEVQDIEGALNVEETKPLLLQGYAVVQSTPDQPIARMLGAYRNLPEVESASANYFAYALEAPDDLLFQQGKQWGLTTIKAPEAWDLTHGSASIKIAILDSGISKNHPDLSSKVDRWVNFAQGTDEDDHFGHGTHVAGIAAALTNNALGVAGTGYDTRLLSVKVLGDDGSGGYDAIINGITWAADHGAKIINMSLGGLNSHPPLENAVNSAYQKGVLIVAAAGNFAEGIDTDSDGEPDLFNPIVYPAYYQNVIAVAATNQSDQKASFSEYGSWVDVAAPGVGIWSTIPNGIQVGESQSCYDTDGDGYDDCSGTSMASPFVAGLAGLILGKNPSLTSSQVRSLIEDRADQISGTGDYWTKGRINALNSVLGAEGPTVTLSPTSVLTPTLTPTPTGITTPSPTPISGPTLTPTPTGFATPSPTSIFSPTPSPTSVLTPTLTISPSGCPSECPSNFLSRRSGNADCNQTIDEEDFKIWQVQFNLYNQGEAILPQERSADFNCTLDDPKTQTVDLLDFEFWRRNSKPGME